MERLAVARHRVAVPAAIQGAVHQAAVHNQEAAHNPVAADTVPHLESNGAHTDPDAIPAGTRAAVHKHSTPM